MSQKPRKLQRVSKAYFDVPCTFDRPAKRRGVKAGTRASMRETSLIGTPAPDNILPVPPAAQATGRMSNSSASRSSYYTESAHRPSLTGDPWSTFNTGGVATEGYDDDGALRNSWNAFAIASDRQIRNLVQVYFEIVYPIFPLFHKQSFIERVHNQEHLRNPGLFATTMAVCALVSGRARDGALFTNRWHRDELVDPPSEAFYAAAKDSIPRDLAAARGINYMRACAILAIVSIQNGQIKNMQKYSGMYHTLTSMEGLHDEKLWPKNLTAIETEERRRLFWSIYTLDIYSTIVWGGVIRYREAHSLVRYPSEVDDEFITPHGYGLPPVSPESAVSPDDVTVVSRQPVAWLRGWNFTTDLYRILEYVVDGNRRRFSSANGTSQVWSLFTPASMSEPAVMERVLSMYAALPSQFKETPPTTGDMSKDLFGFQSANIQATLQLLRMVLLSAEELGVDRKCDVAGELLSVFSKVPVEYLNAISSPLLHHLGGIGYILGSVMEGSLSEASYQRVRTLLLEMADLLGRLETGLQRTAGASQRLRSQVDRIDGYMRTSRLHNLAAQHQRPQHSSIPIDTKREIPIQPTAYIPPSGPVPTVGPPTAMGEQMMQFQLPPELLSDWPWPLDGAHTEGFLPPAFE
ncbi:Transcription factor, fungi [Penicillium expansum]|uniref:Transcription factor, fungi n=1 Tax=Penicillium expansum TaxID=27334 RepID=A0A0A2IDC8_PENEN|nr:Transcription factor, fungi [Penicillium expansum]KGO41054.1 Transcription factor, fungi [Penicillium expansum]KGO58879.1 Transcription factor, fungi [Penicillium expansum]KGO73613.1 Transcription factor, fungi [Penicillium expansum]